MFCVIAAIASLGFVLPLFIRERQRSAALAILLMAVATAMFAIYDSQGPPQVDSPLPVARNEVLFLYMMLGIGWLRIAIELAVAIIKSAMEYGRCCNGPETGPWNWRCP